MSVYLCTNEAWQFIKNTADAQLRVEKTCGCMRESIGLYFADHNLGDTWYVYVLMGLSLLFDGIAFFYIRNYKGLQAHPMKLFMWMSCATFCYFWVLFWTVFFCDIRLDRLFNYTLAFYSNEQEWETL